MVLPGTLIDEQSATANGIRGMTLDKAGEPIRRQPGFCGGLNRNAVRPILCEVRQEHGQAANGLITEPDHEQAFHLAENTGFSRIGR